MDYIIWYFESSIIKENILNNKYILFDEVSEGGIKGLSYWQLNKESNGISCKKCEKEYIIFIILKNIKI